MGLDIEQQYHSRGGGVQGFPGFGGLSQENCATPPENGPVALPFQLLKGVSHFKLHLGCCHGPGGVSQLHRRLSPCSGPL